MKPKKIIVALKHNTKLIQLDLRNEKKSKRPKRLFVKYSLSTVELKEEFLERWQRSIY